MSRILPVKFSMSYKISFSKNIRVHHGCKYVWKPENGEKLDCHKGNHAVGAYKQEKNSTLVGHVSMECSTLVDNFLNADKENRLTAVVAGKRKREVYLVVPAEITGRTKKRNITTILYRELEKKKEKYSGNLN